MEVKAFQVKDVLQACDRLNTISSSGDTLVLVTDRLYKQFQQVGSTAVENSPLQNGMGSIQPVVTLGIYGMHKVSFVEIILKNKTAWVAVVKFDYKEYDATIANNVYVLDLEV